MANYVCASCCEPFNSFHAYQRHRINKKCRSVTEMQALGMERNKRGAWVARRNAFYRVTSGAFSGDRLKVIAE
jgi:hypothetical protein